MPSASLIALFHSPRWPLAARTAAFVLLALFLAVTWWVARFFPIENGLVRHALAFITVQLALLAVLAGQLIIAKSIAIRSEHTQKARRQRLESLLTDALLFAKNRKQLLADCARWPREAEAVFGSALGCLRGDTRVEAERVFIESGLYEKCIEHLHSKNPNIALTAVTLVREVDRDSAREAVRSALLHSFPIVRLAARVAVLKNGTDESKREILEQMGSLPFWQRLALFHYVPNDTELIRVFLEKSLNATDDETVLAALEFLMTRQKAFPLPADLPVKLASSKSPEVRIKLFKALSFFCDARNAAPVLLTGLSDSDWRVRSMAARACGVLRVRAAVPRLLEIAAHSQIQTEVAHAARAALVLSEDTSEGLAALAAAASPEMAAVLREVLMQPLQGEPVAQELKAQS